MRSSLLLCVAHATVVALNSPSHLVATATASPATTENLIEWIRSKKGGIYNPKQEEKTIDDNSRGIFASEDIAAGEILLKVPWDSIIGSHSAKQSTLKRERERRRQLRIEEETEEYRTFFAECRAIENLYLEVRRGEKSDFAPHLRYLSLLGGDDNQLVPTIPTVWSEEGRSLLEDINDHGLLPPEGLFTPLNHDLYGSCIQDIKNNPVEAKVAAVVAAHGSSGNVLSEYGLIVPLFDNYHYNQRELGERPLSDGHQNAKGIVHEGDYFEMVTTRSILKGEQIFRAFGNFFDHEFTMPVIFRDFGIADDFYPKSYWFALPGGDEDEEVMFGLIIDRDDDEGYFEVDFVFDQEELDDSDFEKVDSYFSQELNRLQRLKAVATAHGTGLPAASSMTRYEWDTAWRYHRNLVEAMGLGLSDLRSDKEADAFCPGGLLPTSARVCPLWDGFQYLPNDPITNLDLEFVPGPYGPSDDAYAMCNDEEADWGTYVKAGDDEVIKSQYQDIRFFYHPVTKDMVMKLDTTIQQCSSYRPHYHEFAVHYPARFIETVKRVLFVGGGDSMVLHEVLKYPSLELVVGLELDQYVVRNSFRYFNTQPHFDDKRVEWWFGDGAKSLLMLPQEYFQSFDLVVVDLSETVMSFQVTDKLSIFQTLSLLLKPDGIMLKNGEYYMGTMSEYFDYTLQYFDYEAPFVCDVGMVIGSNNIDFFNRTMKDHGVELLVYESQNEINEKYNEFYRFTEYRKNDARKQGHCGDFDDDSDEGVRKKAGILMVVEVEGVTFDLKSFAEVETKINSALTSIGFSCIDTMKHEPTTVVIVMKEGYVATRLFPEESYVALDIQLWANFHQMESTRDELVEILGGTEQGTSSFRIVTGGMYGSPFEKDDRNKIGPRMVNSRDCEPVSSTAVDGTVGSSDSVDLTKIVLEESLHMIEDGVVAAVLCGAKEESCKSFDVLSKVAKSKIEKVVPLYTCASIQDGGSEFSQDIAKRMAECELEISDFLSNVSSNGNKVSLLVVDDNAKQIMGKTILSIFTSVWNRKRLFASHRFVALVDNSTDAWRRNLLALIREHIVFKPMSFVDLAIENSDLKSKTSILSLHDPDFFLHLKEMVEKFNGAHVATSGTSMEVESIFDGLPPPHIGKFRPKVFKADAYDPNPGKKQLAGQTSSGRQSMMQFEIVKSGSPITGPAVSVLVSALNQSIAPELEFKSIVGKDVGIGNGLVVVAISSDGATNAVVTWDGNAHINVNLFCKDESPKLRELFISEFVKSLSKGVPVKLALSDTHPRGTGRVVSFPGHIN